MRFFNHKYRKICATCKEMNKQEEGKILTCPLKEIFEQHEKGELNDEELNLYLFNSSCKEHQNVFFEPKKIKEVEFDQIEFNVQKDNMTRMVRVCNPLDEERTTFFGYNLGFIPAFPDLDVQEKDKLTVKVGCDLAFYLPELNIVVFNSEAIWFPVKDEDANELLQITKEEKEYFEQNKDDILNIFFPNLFQDLKEKELEEIIA